MMMKPTMAVILRAEVQYSVGRARHSKSAIGGSTKGLEVKKRTDLAVPANSGQVDDDHRDPERSDVGGRARGRVPVRDEE